MNKEPLGNINNLLVINSNHLLMTIRALLHYRVKLGSACPTAEIQLEEREQLNALTQQWLRAQPFRLPQPYSSDSAAVTNGSELKQGGCGVRGCTQQLPTSAAQHPVLVRPSQRRGEQEFDDFSSLKLQGFHPTLRRKIPHPPDC